MQRLTATILSATIAAITVMFLATNGINPATLAILQPTQTQITSESGKVLGHVTYVIRGPDGKILSYMQTDNIRTTQGLNCAANYLFKNNTNSASCPAVSASTGFNYVALLNNTFSTNVADTWSSLGTSSGTSGHIMTTTNQGGPLQQGAVTFPSTGQAQIQAGPFVFTGLSAGGTTITGSGLFNKASSGNLFADNTMNVAVGNQDTLTVTWTITLS